MKDKDSKLLEEAYKQLNERHEDMEVHLAAQHIIESLGSMPPEEADEIVAGVKKIFKACNIDIHDYDESGLLW